MPRQLLLLLIVLGPGNSVRLWETWGDGAEEAPGHLVARGRRQVAMDEEVDTYGDYDCTDPPEVLKGNTEAVTLSPQLQALMATLGQRDSAGLGTPEPATLEVATGDSAGLAAGGAAVGNLSTELATQGAPVTLGPLTKEPVTTIPPSMEAPSTEGALATELATMKALSVTLAVTEALTTQPAATEALSIQPATTEALSTSPADTETLSTSPADTETLSTAPAATETLSMKSTVVGPAVIEALSTEPTTTETLSKHPATTKAPSTQTATTRGLTTALSVPSDPHRGTTVAISNSSDDFIILWRNRQGLSPGSPASPSLMEDLDYIPVKHCLLAILVLALVATTFLVCTVVLAVRLSRRNHMYPVRNYSPTEMVCISSLLAEGGEGPAVTANGGLPTTKSPGLKKGSGEDRDGDDLTLHSFLP